MAYQGFPYSDQEEVAVKNQKLTFEVTLVGSTTLGSTSGYTNAPVGVQVWSQASSATAPSDANFASLVSNATPTVIGLYLKDPRGIKRLVSVTVPTAGIFSPSMTAGVVTYKAATATAALGGSSTGVTTAGTATAFQISCTGLKLTDAANTHKFSVQVEYDLI